MHYKDGYYSSGEFGRMAHITKKTIRYYDEHNILKPSYVAPSGARFYTDADFARLQQILLLKYLGFSLEDIRTITINDNNPRYITDSLQLQLRLVEDRMEQLALVSQTIQDITAELQAGNSIDWSRMLDLIHLTQMEDSLKKQYQNASNISARIHLHRLFAQNPVGWFPWVFSNCPLRPSLRILELGCGDGSLWKENLPRIPQGCRITLSDISDGMLRDARRNLSKIGEALPAPSPRFSYSAFDCHEIPFRDQQFDIVIANHVLFYCKDISQVCREIRRVLKPGGTFVCSTYGSGHMKEINRLVTEFDDRIVLSADKLYERFGRENGKDVLSQTFSHVEWKDYEDFLLVPDADALISYILSCHGNQNQYIINRYQDFHTFVKKKTEKGFRISKEAGIFLCTFYKK